MADMILTWHYEDIRAAGDRVGAAYYISGDYSPIAVRIHAEKAPDVEDAEFEILKDGVSIMNDRGAIVHDIYGIVQSRTVNTTVVLAKGATTDEAADDFKNETIESGSWLTCTLNKDGGGNNFTIQCELAQIEDEDDQSEE